MNSPTSPGSPLSPAVTSLCVSPVRTQSNVAPTMSSCPPEISA